MKSPVTSGYFILSCPGNDTRQVEMSAYEVKRANYFKRQGSHITWNVCLYHLIISLLKPRLRVEAMYHVIQGEGAARSARIVLARASCVLPQTLAFTIVRQPHKIKGLAYVFYPLRS